MANTVTPYVREHGSRKYVPATNAHYPLGTLFVIRYKDRQTGKRIWQNLPGITTFGEAKNAALLKQIELLRVTSPPPRHAPIPVAPAPEPAAPAEKDTLGQAIDLYLANARKLRRKGTVVMYELTLHQFYKSCGGKPLAAISKQDLVDVIDYLKKLPFWKRVGNSDSTIKNKIVIVTSLLRANGILNLKLRVSATPAPALSFHPEMLKKLLAVAGPEERILYQFFISTGCREAEVVHARWDALDFTDRCFRIRKTDVFDPKDYQCRTLPLPDFLLSELKKRLLNSTGPLIFPRQDGKPNHDMRYKLKVLARKAGLTGKIGLHRFRKSYATLQSRQGLDVKTLRDRLGHSEISTTAAYIESEDALSERSRRAVNDTFSVFA